MGELEDKSDSLGPGLARGWLAGLALVCLIGLVGSAYLAALHWAVHNQPGHESFCAVSEGINCDTVALSSYSSLLSVPVSVFGCLFYGWLLVLVGWAWFVGRPAWPWALCSLAFGAACAASAFLFLVSELLIQSVCLLCLGLYAVNLFGVLVCVLGGRRAGLPPAGLASLALCGLALGALGFVLDSPQAAARDWPGVAAIGLAGLAGLVGLNLGPAAGRWSATARALRQDLLTPFARPAVGIGLSALVAGSLVACLVGVPRLYPPTPGSIAGGSADLATGTTPDGHWWIGAREPELTVYEYSDYECSYCRRAHEVVRELVRANRDWLRLVHVHMPLDQSCNPTIGRPFHRHSCAGALATICAAEQGAFWQMNDRLFLRRGGLDAGGLAVLAGELGLEQAAFRACMKSDSARRALQANLEECQRLGLRPATPTFRAAGQIIKGGKGVMDLVWWQRLVDSLRQQNRSAGGGADPAPAAADLGRGGPDGRQAGPGDR